MVRRPFRTGLSMLVALVIGWGMCESVLRMLVPQELFYSTWFTEGVHERDAEFGFVYRPKFRGAMRNADHVWMEPLQLDASGFRQPAIRNETGDSDPLRVIMLGGASMTFCYGLSDAECLHQQVAQRLDESIQIDLISWPGFTLGQDLRKLQRFTSPSEFDLAIVFAHGAEDYRVNSNWDRFEPVDDFRMIDSVVMPADPAADLAGELYYKSYVAAGICRVAQTPLRMISRFNQGQASGQSESHDQPNEQPDDVLSIYKAAVRLTELGIGRVLVIALPHQSQHVGPVTLPPSTSKKIKIIDLRSVDRQEFDWIAYGHYGPKSSAQLGREIAKAIK
ncbi:hypothetical protein Pla52nx_004065 [Stieleria varia]|uniref:hypothetical protein n=1 Tax=Stieleria varia TaxID=2528005 RepID=UPI0011B4EF0C